ncbi:MAG: YgdI/YgdR family lipoprotein [Methanoregula sp.]|nr:YgdI/YgdR family lipoprotein [Methanoregula sp.]
MKKTVVVLLLIIAAVFLAGCTTNTTAGQEIARDTVRAHYEYHEGWSPGLGCYGKVSGYAYNAGNTSVETVAVNLNLVNTRTGTIRDSRSVYIGTMGAGQSVTFETVLDGECMQDYRAEGFIV